MDTDCRLFLVAGLLFLQFLGASFTQGTIYSIPIDGSISPEGYVDGFLQSLRLRGSNVSFNTSRYEVRESSAARTTRGRGIDYGFVSTVDTEERRQGIRDVGYGIRDTWVDPAEAVPEIAPITV
ncbi:hypothetical protein Tco_1495142 [Tanacetum coccineum]